MRFILAAAFFCFFCLALPARAQVTEIPTLGGATSLARGISGDGTIVVGDTLNGAAQQRAFRWTALDGISDLGTLGGTTALSRGISNDGSTIVGNANLLSGQARAFRWTAGGGMENLGTLGGTSSGAAAVNADGTVVTGIANLLSGQGRAFRWVEGMGMQNIGILNGGDTISSGIAINAAGDVIVGYSGNVNRAFRWVDGVGMQDLGTLGGATSVARGVSADGEIVVGESRNGANQQRAFRWTTGTGIEDLNTLGGNQSFAWAINADGTVIVGEAENGALQSRAVRWVDGAGIEDLNVAAANAGIDMTNIFLAVARGVSDDGENIVGQGTFNGDTRGFLLALGGGGLITPEELAIALQGTRAAGQAVQSAAAQGLGQSLLAARQALPSFAPVLPPASPPVATKAQSLADIAPAAGGTTRPPARAWADWPDVSGYVTGNFGLAQGGEWDSHQYGGSTGMFFRLRKDLAIGFGIQVAESDTALYLGGNNRMTSTGINALLAWEPAQQGPRAYASAYAAYLDNEITRIYMNGGGTDTSRGDTTGFSGGGVVMAGWQRRINDGYTRLMPYVRLDVSHYRLDGYSETGGAFPAVVAEESSIRTQARLGLEIQQEVTPALDLRGRMAWGHRFSDDSGFSASSGVVSVGVPGGRDDRDWAEAGLTGVWRVSDNVQALADLAGHTGETAEPRVSGMLGLVIGF